MGTKPISKTNKYDCTRDIYDAVAECTIFRDYVGDGKLHITDAHTYVIELYAIEIFVRDILATTDQAYLISHSKRGKTKITPTTLGMNLGKQFTRFSNMPTRKEIESVICGYRLSSNVNLYFDTLTDGGFWFHNPRFPESDGRLQAEHVNDFLDEIRKKSKDYRDELNQRRKQAADNHKSLRGYLNKLLDKDHYDRLAVVRIDLAYINDTENLVSIDVASAHREKFIGNRYHNKLFEKVVGYAWGLQYLVGKGGYYNHFFIFLDAETLPDKSWHVVLSDYWSGITDGKGRCQNCDKGIHMSNYPGVGIIKRDESEEFIEKAASFLSKKDIYFSLRYVNNGKRFRTFDKGKVAPRVYLYAGSIAE